jgi:hypothetical protein
MVLLYWQYRDHHRRPINLKTTVQTGHPISFNLGAKDDRSNLSESACAKSRARRCADQAVGGIAAARVTRAPI